MQHDGQAAVDMTDDAPEWTLNVDGSQQSDEGTRVSNHMDGGLPPIIPAKAMPGGTAGQRRVLVPMRNDGHREQPGRKPKHVKLAKGRTTVKVASQKDETRRKWKATAKSRSESSGISQTSAMMLFRCSCQLLRNQALDYDVRAREMEERNAAQTRDIDEWEKRLRSLKRELEEYGDEQLDEVTDVALAEATQRSATRAVHEHLKALPSSGFGLIETALPPAVVAVETKVQDELRQRRQKVKEFWKSIPGFLPSQEEQIAHYI